MNAGGSFERCLSFINCHLQAPKAPFEWRANVTGFSTVTISRQAGAGGHSLAKRLAEQLSRLDGESAAWTIFDRNLVEKVLQDHKLPARLSRFMPEDRVSQISDTMDELFGLHPPSWILVRKTSETILHLAELGRVILIGRAANIVTRRLPQVFHVRLVGSFERRIERMQQSGGLTAKATIKVVNEQDRARQRYVRQFFGKNIDDPLLYHLVANTDLLSIDTVARTIVTAMAPNARSLAA
jgi:cytidylate kinase